MTIKAVLSGLHLKKFAEDLHAQRWHLNSLTLQVYLLEQAFTRRARHQTQQN